MARRLPWPSKASSTNSPQLLAALFKAKTDEVVTAPSGEGYALAKLVKVEEAPEDALAKDRLARSITASLADDAAGQFRSDLERDYGVSINRKNLEAVF